MYYPQYKKFNNFNEQLGIAFLGQCLDELLFNHTIDSYKAPATNLHINISELYNLLRHHKEDRIKRGSLQYIIDELLYKVKDNVVFNKTPLIINSLTKLLKNAKTDFKELTTHVNIVLNFLRKEYWDIITNRIQAEIEKPLPDYEAIYKLSVEFVIETENKGFSRAYIYFETQKFFFNPLCSPKKIKDINAIDIFFKRFESKGKKWTIILKSTPNISIFKQFQEKFGIEIFYSIPTEYNVDENTNDFFISESNYNNYIVVKNVPAKDPYNAKNASIQHVDMFLDICQFHDHINVPNISNESLVHDMEANKIFRLKAEPSPMDLWESEYVIALDERVKDTISMLTGNIFTEKSKYAFLKALDFHRSALATQVPEIQLINIWAAIEGFLPPPSKDDDRIIHYLSILVPHLTLTYSEKILKYISTNMMSYKQSADFTNSISYRGSEFDKCVVILTCREMTAEREELYNNLKKHPLLLYRAKKIHNDFNSRRNINATIRKHTQRLELHIQRIYTLRNLIVHTAESLPYIKTLIYNLHNYFDSLINSISTTGSQFKVKQVSIQTAVSLLRSHYNIYLDELSEDEEATSLDNYKDVIFGANNILSPYK